MPARTVGQKRMIRLTGVLTLIMMAVIFIFSAQNAMDSTQVSSGLLQQIIDWERPIAELLAGRSLSFMELELYLRKAGHFTEYLLLGLFVSCHLRLVGRRHGGWWSFLIGSGYAVTDELHQLLSEGRYASTVDVCIDSCGVATGLLLCAVIAVILRKTCRRELKKNSGSSG